MNEEFVQGITLAIKRNILTKEEGKKEILNMIHAEQGSKGLNLMALIDRLETLEAMLLTR